MTKNLSMPSYIIILGTTYSGSGAIYDYLSGRGDLRDPLNGVEYQLPHMPNGLMTLEAIADKSFHAGTADFVLSEFINITQKLSRDRTAYRYGKSYKRMLPLFNEAIDEFIENISAAKLPMNLHWRRLMSGDSKILHFLSKLKYRLGIKVSTPLTRILVSREKFIDAAQKLNNKIFLKDDERQPVLINQGGSGWNPVESTKYFSNCKVLLVLRDPRDQFVEIKQYKKAKSIDGFIDWYKEMQFRLKAINNNNLLKINFEDFVKKNHQTTDLLCKHLSISTNVDSSYQPDLSRKNIGKYKKFLKIEEIDLIEKSLSEYIF